MSVLTTAAVSFFTAIFTVVLTIWFYQKRDKINALRAIKSEAKQNRGIAKNIIRHISTDKELRKDSKEQPTSIQPLSNTSYLNIKNSGILTEVSGDTRRTIIEHYSHVDFANHQLKYRQQTRSSSRALANFLQIVEKIDSTIEREMVQLGAVELDITTEAADHPEIDDALDEITTFDDVVKACDKELRQHPILSQLI